jgi:adenosylhomocysteine nucleosidase
MMTDRIKVTGTPLGTGPEAGTVCISGLAAEAKIARAAGFSVVIRAGDRDHTAALVATAAAQTDCLVSFGIAGGLAPDLKAGTVVVSGEVVSEGCHWAVESQHLRRLNDFARSIGATLGPVLGATSILATRTEKKQAWARTGALVVDLESEIVARTATALGIPFIVLRSIADTAQRDLPPASLVPLSADGKPDLLGVLAAVVRRPFQVTEMIGLAQETVMALSALIGPARALRSFVVIT